jgi:hypothetical protein
LFKKLTNEDKTLFETVGSALRWSDFKNKARTDSDSDDNDSDDSNDVGNSSDIESYDDSDKVSESSV